MARKHRCPWPGCHVQDVPSFKWGCGEHFRALPQDLRDQLVRIPRHWPEAKTIRARATSWARAEAAKDRKAARDRERAQAAAQAASCRVCGGPPSPRLVRYCVQCHIVEFTGDRS